MAKAKRYDEGGVTEGQNKGIDDDTRARAMKYVQEQSEKADSEEPEVKAKTVTKAKVTKTKETPKSETKTTVTRSTEREPSGEPTPSKGNSASGSELGRNIKNTLMALGPTRLAGLGNAAAEGVMASRAAKAAKTAQAAREAKTLNPNAWLAGPKGMKENFKKGGSVKGWGISRGARAAKVY